MIVEIDDDFADQIVQNVLLDSYISLKKDLKLAAKNPNHMDPEDMEAYAATVVAIESLGRWFFVNFEQAVKDFKKIRK